MNAMKQNRTACVEFGSRNIANVGDSIESDMIEAQDEDDLQAVLSHLEILERNCRTLRDMVKATLEGRSIE